MYTRRTDKTKFSIRKKAYTYRIVEAVKYFHWAIGWIVRGYSAESARELEKTAAVNYRLVLVVSWRWWTAGPWDVATKRQEKAVLEYGELVDAYGICRVFLQKTTLLRVPALLLGWELGQIEVVEKKAKAIYANDWSRLPYKLFTRINPCLYGFEIVAKAIKSQHSKKIGKKRNLLIAIHDASFQYIYLVLLA